MERIAGLSGKLEGLLQELKALEIIYEQGLLPEPAYIFKHAVIQDVAYNSLLKERRRELHRAVGGAIEELYPDRLADHYQELAHHFVNGEDWPKAFEYLVRSGDRAKDAFANQTALDSYAKALEVASRVSPPLAPRRIMEIYQRRGQIWRLMSRPPDAIAELDRMLAMAREAGDRFAEAQALVDLSLTHWLWFSSEHAPLTKSCAEEALRIGREIGDEEVVAKSLSYLGLVYQVAGDLVRGDEKLEESLRISEARGFKDAIAQNLTWLGAHAGWRGEFHKAIPLCHRAEETARENHDGLSEVLGLAFRCLALIGLGDYGQGLTVINEGLTKARDRETVWVIGRLTNSLGWLYQELGDFRRSTELNRESQEMGHRIKNQNVEVSALINIGYDHFHLGETDKALAVLEDSLVRVEESAFGAHRWRWAMHLATYLAEALLAAGPTGTGALAGGQGTARRTRDRLAQVCREGPPASGPDRAGRRRPGERRDRAARGPRRRAAHRVPQPRLARGPRLGRRPGIAGGARARRPEQGRRGPDRGRTGRRDDPLDRRPGARGHPAGDLPRLDARPDGPRGSRATAEILAGRPARQRGLDIRARRDYGVARFRRPRPLEGEAAFTDPQSVL